MEEDAGKSIHDRYPGVTAIDLNRAGVPLIEIVSEPDMRSSREAGAYLRALKQLLEYLDVSDVNMEEGSLRVDANVSARPRGATTLGTKTEVKNMNSFSGVERALEMEFERQCALLARGETVHQQTMLWDGARGEVRPARSKEGSHDYRYFAEPDLPPLDPRRARSSRSVQRGAARAAAREARALRRAVRARRRRRRTSLTSTVAGRRLLRGRREGARRREGRRELGARAKSSPGATRPGGRSPSVRSRATRLAELLDLIRDGIVSSTAAKKIFEPMTSRARTRARAVRARDRRADSVSLQERDSGALAGGWMQVLAEHPVEAARFLGGEKKLQGVLVGLVMKKSQGRADPKQVNQLLAERGSRTGA